MLLYIIEWVGTYIGKRLLNYLPKTKFKKIALTVVLSWIV